MQLISPELRFRPTMDAKYVEELPEGTEWAYEIKFDGYRIQPIKQRGEVRLYSRRGKDFTSRYPGVAEEILRLRLKEFVLDAEAVAVDENGNHVFNLLQRSGTNKAPVHLYIFDVLFFEGKDVTGLTLRKRRKILESRFGQQLEFVHLSPILQGEPAALLAAVEDQGFEGVMAKRWDSKYECGEEPGTWVKHKAQPTEDFYVGGYIPGSAGMDELVVGRREGKELLFMSCVRAGFVPRVKKQVLSAIKPLRSDVCPFTNLPERKGEHKMDAEKMARTIWLLPDILAEIAYNNVTPDGHLRHSKFLRLREPADLRPKSRSRAKQTL